MGCRHAKAVPTTREEEEDGDDWGTVNPCSAAGGGGGGGGGGGHVRHQCARPPFLPPLRGPLPPIIKIFAMGVEILWFLPAFSISPSKIIKLDAWENLNYRRRFRRPIMKIFARGVEILWFLPASPPFSIPSGAHSPR